MKLTANDGHQFEVYEGRATGASGAGDDSRIGIVVIQEVFGVNHHIRSVTDRFADAGFLALAPAFFDRVEPNIELGYEAEDVQQGIGYVSKLTWDSTMDDLAVTIDHLRSQGASKIGVVGFCWGGTASWIAANRGLADAAVGYYGGGILSLADSAPTVPTILHFGALDAHIPIDGVKALDARYPDVDVYIYEDADHGFHCDARASYHSASAGVAWDRTLAFFREQLS